MRCRTLLFFAVLTVSISILPWAASPAFAGCVSCGPGGECFEASPGFSANCECRIRSINGAVICKPSGICDPRDSSTCSDDPWVNVSPGAEISTKFVNRLGLKNPLVAGAVWGAITEDPSTSRSRVSAGVYTGTMGKDGRSFTFQTEVRQTAVDAFSLSIRLEEDATGQVEEFEGVLLEGGRSGSIFRVTKGEARARVFSWRVRDRLR